MFCPGVACGSDSNAPRILLLLYADDLVILNENAADLQGALDAAHNWATAWRFHFSVVPTKSAVMVFGRGHANVQAFHVGVLDLPRVRSYTTLQERLSWNLHVAELLDRGERKMAACLSWTSSVNLPPSFVERSYQTYVHPSITFALELIPAGPHLARFQKRILQWGRRLLGWPRGSPSLVVQGAFAWPDANTIRLSLMGIWIAGLKRMGTGHQSLLSKVCHHSNAANSHPSGPSGS